MRNGGGCLVLGVGMVLAVLDESIIFVVFEQSVELNTFGILKIEDAVLFVDAYAMEIIRSFASDMFIV
jgi:hypothetical protein